VTVQGEEDHVTSVDERLDRTATPYYWIEEGLNEWEPHDRLGHQAVRDGYISITPLQPDMTAHDGLSYVEALPLTDQPVAGR
jgi:5'-nucleotidase